LAKIIDDGLEFFAERLLIRCISRFQLFNQILSLGHVGIKVIAPLLLIDNGV